METPRVSTMNTDELTRKPTRSQQHFGPPSSVFVPTAGTTAADAPEVGEQKHFC